MYLLCFLVFNNFWETEFFAQCSFEVWYWNGSTRKKKRINCLPLFRRCETPFCNVSRTGNQSELCLISTAPVAMRPCLAARYDLSAPSDRDGRWWTTYRKSAETRIKLSHTTSKLRTRTETITDMNVTWRISDTWNKTTYLTRDTLKSTDDFNMRYICVLE
jgi:hypothetical protein